MLQTFDRIAAFKPLLFVLALSPLGLLVWKTSQNTLGPDPVAYLEHNTGIWALRLLLATLAVTPLRKLSGWNGLIRFRRMLGLFAFFYASIHLATYLIVDLGGFWSQILVEIAKKPFVTAGFLAWLLMIPLAITSTKGMMRRLGRNWQRLHRLVYASGAFAALHFLWQVKYGETIAALEPVVYAGVFLALMLARIPAWLKLRKARSRQPVKAGIAQ
jgi:methionine sulfoxide reductase heme-binding subunit